MYRVCKEHKVKNVKDENGHVRHYYGGEKLPKNYQPPISYIEQKIVEEAKNAKNR